MVWVVGLRGGLVVCFFRFLSESVTLREGPNPALFEGAGGICGLPWSGRVHFEGMLRSPVSITG